MASGVRSESVRRTFGFVCRFWLVPACLVSALFLYIKCYERLTDPELWAEDGTIFLVAAYSKSVPESLFELYAGYVHLIPRIIAEIATHFSLYATPFIYAWASYIVAVIMLVLTVARKIALEYKLAALIAVPLSFGAQEIYLNPTNVQWFVGLYVLSLLAGNISRRDWLAIPIVFLTGPYGAFVSLVWLASRILEQLGRWIAVALAQRTGAAGAGANKSATIEKWLVAAGLVIWVALATLIPIVSDIERRIVLALGSFTFGAPSLLLEYLLVSVFVVGPILIWDKMSRFDRRLYLFCLIYWLSIGYKASVADGQPVLGGGGSRYYFLQEVVFLYAAFRILFQSHAFSRIPRPYIFASLAVLFLAMQFRYPTLWPYSGGGYEEDWVPQVDAFYSCQTNLLLIEPGGWAIEMPFGCY